MGGARILDTLRGGAGLSICGSDDEGVLQIYINEGTTTSGKSAYAATDAWIFFAVTYNSEEKQAIFYIGSPDDEVRVVNTRTLEGGELVLDTDQNLGVGNVAEGIRPFAGEIDNLRIFGSDKGRAGALDLASLESIRKRDLQNKP